MLGAYVQAVVFVNEKPMINITIATDDCPIDIQKANHAVAEE